MTANSIKLVPRTTDVYKVTRGHTTLKSPHLLLHWRKIYSWPRKDGFEKLSPAAVNVLTLCNHVYATCELVSDVRFQWNRS
ncbi:hypothetical protein M8J75_005928 [Diaphorina citri]|nr:hypothetical protein M8J75_005928 [Diaphorina citri]